MPALYMRLALAAGTLTIPMGAGLGRGGPDSGAKARQGPDEPTGKLVDAACSLRPEAAGMEPQQGSLTGHDRS